jgi:hypothetical protein
MRRRIYHLLLPTLMSARFFVIVAASLATLGCRTRGLLALLVALPSGLAAVGAVLKGARSRRRQEADAPWWVASALIWIIPVVALLYLA